MDSIVETPAGRGIITESSFLSGKIKVRMNGDQNAPVKVFTKDEVKVVGSIKRRDENTDDLRNLEEK